MEKNIKKVNIGQLKYLNDIHYKNIITLVKLFFYSFFLIFISMKKETVQLIKNKLFNIFPEHKYKFFSCFCGIARNENLYARELIEYYINIGIDKFYLGDHNLVNTEKLIDVLRDYVDTGNVEIIDLLYNRLCFSP